MSNKLYGDQLVVHIKNPELVHDNTLHIIGVISNPVRYQSRYRIAREWITHMAATKNVHLTIVETAYGDRQHELKEICESLGVDYIPFRTHSGIWIKENMINMAYKFITCKYPGASYFGHIDADVFFTNPEWAQEAMHQLQHFCVIQPWSDCVDLGPSGEIIQAFKSFGHQHQKRVKKQTHPSQPYQYAHSGFAWCWRREFWEIVRGLMDWPILGSGDHHMAFAMVGDIMQTIHAGMHKHFFEMGKDWQARAIQATKKEVGFVMGRIEHCFHGPKNRRFYRERWQILVDHGFDPKNDLMYDRQGIIQLKGKPELEHAVHAYNLSRHEDSIETY